MPRPIKITDEPCAFCEPSPTKKQITGGKRCRECERIYQGHERVAQVGSREEAEMLDMLCGPVDPKTKLRTGGLAEQVRLASNHASRQPQGYVYQEAAVIEFRDGVRRGRY